MHAHDIAHFSSFSKLGGGSAVGFGDLSELKRPEFWSTLVLLGFVVLAATLFFSVVRPFLLPMLFSAVLSVLFRPLHLGLTRSFCRRRRIAAMATTVTVIAGFMLPLSGALYLAGIELVQTGDEILATTGAADTAIPVEKSPLARVAESLTGKLSEGQLAEVNRIFAAIVDAIRSTAVRQTHGFVGDAAMFGIGVVVMVLGFYYLLADGDRGARQIENLIPLERSDQRLLFDRFESVCRGVVVGTVAAGLLQGLLAGVAFFLLGVERVWMLAVLTVLFSFIPLLGAAMIWIPVVVALILDDRYTAATFLTIYGTFVISLSDNFVKAYVIGNRARMHPFVVLVTVLGALRLVGLWGIFLGPIVAAFFYALLTSFQQRILIDRSQL